jgi:hypothetical protein
MRGLRLLVLGKEASQDGRERQSHLDSGSIPYHILRLRFGACTTEAHLVEGGILWIGRHVEGV